jgi:hypothetical protein
VGVVTIGGVDVTKRLKYGSLQVSQQINDQPDTASFSVDLTDGAIQAAIVVGADVRIGLGVPEHALFGGRILTVQTARGPARTPSVRSVMCADYLQVLDSEYLVTYSFPAQSATATIIELIGRFTGKPGGVVISTSAVQPGLPSHEIFSVVNEHISAVLRRLVTAFPAGGGFYIDPLGILHVWQGVSEPGMVNPAPVTIDSAALKAFADTVDGAQMRDACLVEGMRTTAPYGFTAPVPAGGEPVADSLPVVDASIVDPLASPGVDREVRIGTQRFLCRYFYGPWSAPAGTPTSTYTMGVVPFNPDPSVENNTVRVPVQYATLLTGRDTYPRGAWIRIDDQYLKVIGTVSDANGVGIIVPRTGFGAPVGFINAGAAVSNVDSLAYLRATGRYQTAPGVYEPLRNQAIGAEVVLTVRAATGAGIHEFFVQDQRYSRTGATNRGAQEIADFVGAVPSIEFETEDLNARPGRLQAYSFDVGHPSLAPTSGQYMIMTADISWPVWGALPRVRCTAAKVQAANVVDLWVTDTR